MLFVCLNATSMNSCILIFYSVQGLLIIIDTYYHIVLIQWSWLLSLNNTVEFLFLNWTFRLRVEQQYCEAKSAQLGKSYRIVATVQILPKTKFYYTCNSLTYLAQRVQIEISASITAMLLVHLESMPRCYSYGKGTLYIYVHMC